jgi:hypothetical protein
MSTTQRTPVLLQPDTVRRGLVGEVGPLPEGLSLVPMEQRTLPPEAEDHIYEMSAVARAKAGITSLPVDLGEALRRMEASWLAVDSEPLCVRRASPSVGVPDRSGTLSGTVHGDVVGRIRVCAVLSPMSYVLCPMSSVFGL